MVCIVFLSSLRESLSMSIYALLALYRSRLKAIYADLGLDADESYRVVKAIINRIHELESELVQL
jgi:hypothetical protein